VSGVRGGMQAVNRLRGNLARGIKSDGLIGAGDIVIGRLGQHNHIQASLAQVQAGLDGFFPPNAYQRVKFMPFIGVHRVLGQVRCAFASRHSLWDAAADAQDGSAQRQDARKHPAAQVHRAVFHQAIETIPEANQFQVFFRADGFSNPADGGIHARAVASGSQQPDSLFHSYLTGRAISFGNYSWN